MKRRLVLISTSILTAMHPGKDAMLPHRNDVLEAAERLYSQYDHVSDGYMIAFHIEQVHSNEVLIYVVRRDGNKWCVDYASFPICTKFGYSHPSQPREALWNAQTEGFTRQAQRLNIHICTSDQFSFHDVWDDDTPIDVPHDASLDLAGNYREWLNAIF